MKSYPQSPLNQSYTLNYPIIAYKGMSPHNRKVAIVNLAQDIPQIILNLGKLKFVSFISRNYIRGDISKKIMILVKDENGKLKILVIIMDPWKRIDRDCEFNMPESMYFF